MGEIGFCTADDILKEAARLLITDITADSGVPLLLVRALHNKILYFFLTSLRCYIHYFDIQELVLFVSPILYPFILFTLLNNKWKALVLLFFIFSPLFFIFNPFHLSLGNKIYAYQGYFILLSAAGFVKAFLIMLKRHF